MGRHVALGTLPRLAPPVSFLVYEYRGWQPEIVFHKNSTISNELQSGNQKINIPSLGSSIALTLHWTFF